MLTIMVNPCVRTLAVLYAVAKTIQVCDSPRRSDREHLTVAMSRLRKHALTTESKRAKGEEGRLGG